jgi:hypothetical protein
MPPEGCLTVSQATEVTQQNGGPETRRQPGNLAVDDGSQLAHPYFVYRFGRVLALLDSFLAPPRSVAPAAVSDSERDAVKPVRKELAVVQGIGALDQERCLEGVLDVVRIVEQPLTEAKNHRPMS